MQVCKFYFFDITSQSLDKLLGKKESIIAEDIYETLTMDFGNKHTAAEFAKKYGVSDTTAKKYFKQYYGENPFEYRKAHKETEASLSSMQISKEGHNESI